MDRVTRRPTHSERDPNATASAPLRLTADGPSVAAAMPPSKAAQALVEAKAVLVELEANLRVVEAKLAEDRRQDPIRQVTGVSSLESAISSTRDLISALEASAALAREAESI